MLAWLGFIDYLLDPSYCLEMHTPVVVDPHKILYFTFAISKSQTKIVLSVRPLSEKKRRRKGQRRRANARKVVAKIILHGV